VVLEELQLAHLAEDRRLRARLTWWKNRAHHRRVLAAVTMATAPSELEAARARAIAPSARVEVLPNGVDLTRLTPDPGAAVDLATLISAGSPTYAPNLDAAIWFGREVLPRVRARVPGARLVVTGERGGSTLPDIPGVEWVGRLDDVADAVRAAGCSVVALRAGGGTRVKILESLALGTPVVSTSKGAEGLGLVAGAELEVADDAAGFADAVVTVVTDPARRAELAAAGRAAAEARDWAPIRARWAELVAEVTVTDR
jgi:glycosyltransferase involved in cell wall biosynthesis